MTKAKKGKDMFRSSYNCAQSVAVQFAADAGFDENTVCKMACAFGAGGGRKQYTCGAVTGALLAISMLKGRELGGVKSGQDEAYAFARELIDRFEATFGTVQCRTLVDDADLLTSEGQARFRDERLGEKCSTYVAESICILEEILAR
jgi:C_GCAxxG_C_C family probable redox protein